MKDARLTFIKITHENFEIFKNLSQAYEAEFSNLTQKMPDKLGFFKVETVPFASYVGYLLYWQEIPVGFCVANIESQIKDIAEFYIIPAMRKKKLGYQLAVMIFNQYPGEWQVRQIEGAKDAISFWRSVIKKYTLNQYEESVVHDNDWGAVTRQRFLACSAENTGNL